MIKLTLIDISISEKILPLDQRWIIFQIAFKFIAINQLN